MPRIGLIDRPELIDEDLNIGIRRLQKEVARQLNEKGNGAFVTRHEILGAVVEEVHELTEAVRSKHSHEVANELYDVAVVCIVGAVSIESGKTV